MAKRRSQVVRHRVGKRLQVFVGRLEFFSSLGEFLVEVLDLVLALSSLLHFDLKPVVGLAKTLLDAA
jgi:hypothetical protein